LRVDFGGCEKQKSFFKRSKPPFSTWKDFYGKILDASEKSFSFRAFQHWYKGERLPTLKIVCTICDLSGVDFSHLGIQVKEEAWGQTKGGEMRIKLHGCNLDKRNRVLGGKAAQRVLISKLGADYEQFMRKISSKGGINSVISKKNLMRKTIGPKGECMFNQLEKDVAHVLLSANVTYQYEPVLTVDHQTIIPDFKIGNLIIECTKWTNAKVKAMSLKEKIKALLARHPYLYFIVITKDALKKRYVPHLKGFAEVLSIREFRRFMTEQTFDGDLI